MDNSQSSGFFSDKRVNYDGVIMDTESYYSLVCNTKKTLQCEIQSEIMKATFSSFFSTLLEDCRLCITQSLHLIRVILLKPNININNLIEYIDDSVCLLQILSDFIKTVVESVSLSCSNMKTFPTSTGHIIMIVFLHCKDSDSLYGIYLNNVEKQLKDLFRTCHELQLTYLMVIENHFVFDLSEKEQLDVLNAALEINLEIGEIVEILDVKTMAEQWKAYVAICEKYYSGVLDRPIYNDSTKVLCRIIENNIKTALEHNQEEKVIVRSVKVSSFLIKILLKICCTLKQSTVKNQDLILELFFYVYSNSYISFESAKSMETTNLMRTNVLCAVDLLLRELLLDQTFVNCLFNYAVHKIRKEDKLLGYILLNLSVIKAVIQSNNDKQIISKKKIISCVYSFLPYCHLWFNMGIKFHSESIHYQTEGLYEHALTYMTGFAMTLNIEEYYILERYMVEALLGTDYVAALFSSNLWAMLARVKNGHLLANQLISLCKIYRKFECNELFEYSPQKVHLSCTISTIFEVLETEAKIQIYKEFSHYNENMSIMCLLEIKSLPDHIQMSTEEIVSDKLKVQFRKLTSYSDNIEEMNDLINYMNLVASCSFTLDNGLVELLIKAWMKSCFENNFAFQGELDSQSLWFFQYVRALVSLTSSCRHDFCEISGNIVKALHSLRNMAKSRNVELKLVLIDIFLNLILYEVYDENKNNIDFLSEETSKYLLQNTDNIIRFKLLCSLRTYKDNKKIDKIISILNSEDNLKQIWNSIIQQDLTYHTNLSRDKLMKSIDNVYTHKCIKNNFIEIKNAGCVYDSKHSGNFDLADGIDTLFENESEPEPVCKKVKFNNDDNEADVIITKLENEVFKLNKVKEKVFTIEQKNRILEVRDKLKNVIY